MKEVGKLFQGLMVRAIMREVDPKTQTRRVIPHFNGGPQALDPDLVGEWKFEDGAWSAYPKDGGDLPIITGITPGYSIGDRIWVREAWRVGKGYDELPGSEFKSNKVWYEADGDAPKNRAGRYRHARFMPRWASRIDLDVVGVRVERLQDISYEDALAEGVADYRAMIADECNYETPDQCARRLRWPQREYELLWESINGAGSWALNPPVYVTEFKRILT